MLDCYCQPSNSGRGALGKSNSSLGQSGEEQKHVILGFRWLDEIICFSPSVVGEVTINSTVGECFHWSAYHQVFCSSYNEIYSRSFTLLFSLTNLNHISHSFSETGKIEGSPAANCPLRSVRGGTQSWTGDLLSCTQMPYHGATPSACLPTEPHKKLDGPDGLLHRTIWELILWKLIKKG